MSLDEELNFDDIAGKKTKKLATTSDKKLGISLFFPAEEEGSWIEKDISQVTGNEFVTWASRVYPISLTEDTRLLDKLPRRIEAFKHIMHYHANSPFQTGKDGKRNTTQH